MWTLEMWNFLFKDSTWKCSFWTFFVKMWVGPQMWTLEMWNFLFKDSTWKCSFWRFFVKMWVGSQMWTLADWNFLSKNSTRKWKKPSIYILRLVHSIPGLYIIHLYSYTYTYAYTCIVFEFGMLGSNFEGHKPIWHVHCFFLKVQVPNVRKALLESVRFEHVSSNSWVGAKVSKWAVLYSM